MAELLQQLDPSKLVLAETVSSNNHLKPYFVSLDEQGSIFPHLAFHLTPIQPGNISLRHLCPRKYWRSTVPPNGGLPTHPWLLLHWSINGNFQFTGLVGLSFIFDIVYMARNEQNWFIRLVTIIIQIIKVRQVDLLKSPNEVIDVWFIRCQRSSLSG